VSSGDEISKPFSYILEVVEEEMVKIWNLYSMHYHVRNNIKLVAHRKSGHIPGAGT
jgi:hypothetical protein